MTTDIVNLYEERKMTQAHIQAITKPDGSRYRPSNAIRANMTLEALLEGSVRLGGRSIDPFQEAVPCWQDRELFNRLGLFDGAFFRMARKAHNCNGGHDGARRVRCDRPITTGDLYVEYLGESPAYLSGQHFHIECAVQQGLLKR